MTQFDPSLLSVSPSEQWRPVAGHDGYFVSPIGRVLSMRMAGHIRRPHILNPFKCRGYSRVQLRHGPRKLNAGIHRLVAAAFIGAIPTGMQINHRDGNKQNNAVENLEIVTPKQNMEHCVRSGLNANHRKTHCKRGHEFTPENTRFDRRGGRYCKACQRVRRGYEA